MAQKKDYRQALLALSDWDDYLMAESGLPGPRGNLELAQVAADEASRAQIDHWLAFDAQKAPVNTPGEFLAFCGAVGLGKLVAQGETSLLKNLRACASDPRWRMREGVAIALQRLGKVDMPRLIDEMDLWSEGNWLEKRAAAAALAEPVLLDNAQDVRRVLRLMDRITTSMAAAPDRKSEAFKTLRQGMGYCWSVAVAALPADGKPLMEAWFQSRDSDVVWMMKENLKKNRLERVDAAWVAKWKAWYDAVH